ncbi:MAG: glutamine-hydrolyzing GMP synthase [Lachnospiraceae bacterium]|nr:glutamine-hydrolyzing GMP synthase [Lachnospiraceae bacterium]
MKRELIIVIDFGGQYNQLVARRVRECNVYCEIYSYKTDISKIKEMNPKGIILTGGPNSCYEEGAPSYSTELFKLGIPVLGLCYGAQLMMYELGGAVSKAPVREYGKIEVNVNTSSPLFKKIPESTICWMSHNDYISKIAPGFEVVATTAECPVAAAQNLEKKLFAIQFHPEVLHTIKGKEILSNYVYNVCGCSGDWTMDSFVDYQINAIREKVGGGKVLLALSGGVDSSVAAVLLSKAIGKQLTCVFVDHGLLRKNEGDEVEAVFGPKGQYDLNFVRVNAAERYYGKLSGVADPEAKRKIIGEEFIRIFEEEAKKIGTVDFLVQGTIYPDVVESGLGGESAVIKSHHNVGGLPEHVDFKEIIEPLRDLFKDEVRRVGLELGIPEYLVYRQPFPGPGLGVRIVGEVTAEKVRIVQDADAIYREEIDKAVKAWREGAFAAEYEDADKDVSEKNAKHSDNEYPSWMPNQYFAALTNMRSVGVMGDERTYDYAVALRAVKTIDFMTAESAQIPWQVLQTVMNRIINEVKGVNRVFYDLTSKPPGTIELE